MIVSMFMTRNPVTVASDTPLARAAQEMTRLRVRRLPVVDLIDGHPTLVGILSKHDLLHAYQPGVNPFGVHPELGSGERVVGDVMTRHPLTTSPDAPIEEVARILRDKKFGAMPVLVGEKLVGIITESDLFKALVSVMGADRAGVRLTFEGQKGSDVLGTISQLARRRGLQVASLMSAHYDGHWQYVVRVHGARTEEFVEDVWNSGFKVLNVLEVKGEG